MIDSFESVIKKQIDLFEKEQTMIYLGDEEYHGILIDNLLDKFFDILHNEFDKILPNDLDLIQRGNLHLLLDRRLYDLGFGLVVDQYGIWMLDHYNYDIPFEEIKKVIPEISGPLIKAESLFL